MKILIKMFLAIHVFIYRLTSGKLMGKFGSNPILLLDTVGRKSGQKRTTPLMYLRDGKNYVVAASNGGADAPPGWYFNLKGSPKTMIQVLGEKITVNAQEAPTKERDRLWKQLTTRAPQFAEYEKKTSRVIPMFILRPVGK
jgi:deazaflavin-dependent oxidoreductase (nitroreductase family)